jgi:hypothetical protein
VNREAEPGRPAAPYVVLAIAAVSIAAAFVLYQPAMRLGLLSDDYALLMWARRLELAPRDWGQIRPLPILSWWVLATLTSANRTPVTLHGLSLALHGLNACLVWVLAGRFTSARWTPLLAGALFLVWPTSVEPVVWASGIFDVMLTTFALLLAVVVTSREELRVRDQALALLLTIGMIASKETGVIAGPLTVLLAWTRWSRVSRRTWALALAQLLLAGTYTLGRELTDRLDHRLVPRLDAGGLGRILSGTARAFVLPLHRDLIERHPLLAIAVAVAVVLLLTSWVFRWRTQPGSARLAVLAGVGTLLCVAPAIRLFGITPDLQGTRYVYLAAAWWSIAVAAALLEGWRSPNRRRAALAVAGLAVAGAALVTRVHLEPWTAARTTRDRVLRQLIAIPPSCQQAAVTGVPDNVSGAYVFRNGLNEALATLGRSFEWVDADRVAPECRMDLAAGIPGRADSR